MKKEILEKMILSRISLLMKHPFFGNLATRLQLNASDEITTAATDGRNIFYNENFIESLSQAELDFVIAHEVLHVCYDHLSRFEGKNKVLSNIAADYVVNRDLIQFNVGQKPEMALYDKKYDGYSFEQVYEELKKESDETIRKLSMKLIDDHMSLNNLSEEEKQTLKDEIKEAMISAYNLSSGKVPEGIERLIKSFTQSKMNWKQLLQQNIESCFNSDFTWIKPNRRSSVYGVIMPSMNRDIAIDLAIGIDASGSISEIDLQQFLSEVNAIANQFSNYTITIWTFDTKVYNQKQFTSDNIDELFSYKAKGGGGTSFKCNWDFMEENNINPKKFIIFTDGMYGDLPSDKQKRYCDTLFVIYNKYWNDINNGLNFGEIVKMEK